VGSNPLEQRRESAAWRTTGRTTVFGHALPVVVVAASSWPRLR
jgi:hypothetical protein